MVRFHPSVIRCTLFDFFQLLEDKRTKGQKDKRTKGQKDKKLFLYLYIITRIPNTNTQKQVNSIIHLI
jgi:hypothetical protein